jgi:hypothetical protein
VTVAPCRRAALGYLCDMTLLTRWADSTRKDYDPDGDVNLTGFAGSLTAFVSATAATALVARAQGRTLPERYAASDVVLGGLAAHKFSRMVSKSSVTSPIRAPFTTFEGAAGSSEHTESPRGEHGLRHTVGEFLTCPFCVGTWVSAAYVGGLTISPRVARAWAAVFAVTALSDGLQQAYARLRDD